MLHNFRDTKDSLLFYWIFKATSFLSSLVKGVSKEYTFNSINCWESMVVAHQASNYVKPTYSRYSGLPVVVMTLFPSMANIVLP